MVRLVPMVLTPGWGRPDKPMSDPRGIVVHWTANLSAGADAIANRNWFEKFRGYKVSAHFVVDDKQIVSCVPETEVAYHAGTATKPQALALFGRYPNNHAIGIEWCVNRGSNGGETYKNVVGLCGEICSRHNWGPGSVLRHFDVTGKLCPAFFVDDRWAQQFGFTGGAAAAWQQFLRDVVVGTRAAEVAAISRLAGR